MKSLHHPTAIIDKKADIDTDVSIGPYVKIESGTRIGKGTTIDAHSCIKKGVTIGENNVIAENVVIGGDPQVKEFDRREESFVKIGARNIFREHVTVHRSALPGQATHVKNDNFFMAQAHLAHDVKVESHIVVANSSLLGGYVEIGEHAFISGHVVIHQYTRVGKLAMISGLIRVTSDVPPFALAAGFRACFAGLNVIGLRRHNIPASERLAIRKFYKEFYNSSKRSEFLQNTQPSTSSTKEALFFIQNSTRGIIKSREEILKDAKISEFSL